MVAGGKVCKGAGFETHNEWERKERCTCKERKRGEIMEKITNLIFARYDSPSARPVARII